MEREVIKSPEIQQASENFKVLSKTDFYKEFALDAKSAKRRVWLRTMYVQAGDVMELVEPALHSASKNRVEVKVVADAVSLLLIRGVPTYLPYPPIKNNYQETKRMFERLADDPGISLDFTNPPTGTQKIFPYTGRNHVKLAAIDDSFYIGGSNSTVLSEQDFMVKITDPNLTTHLEWSFDKYNDKKIKEDKEIVINEENTLLLDSGIPGRSVIYEHALNLVKQEEESLRLSIQFLPDGELSKGLIEAKRRGVNVEVLTSSQDEILEPTLYLMNRLNVKKLIRNPDKFPVIFLPAMVHAKALIGSDKTIFGSNNFYEAGVRAGTEEIALESSNPSLIQNLNNFLDMIKNQNYPKV